MINPELVERLNAHLETMTAIAQAYAGNAPMIDPDSWEYDFNRALQEGDEYWTGCQWMEFSNTFFGHIANLRLCFLRCFTGRAIIIRRPKVDE